MKRLRRIAWNGLAGVSALLCMASVALWIRGHWKFDFWDIEYKNLAITIETPPNKLQFTRYTSSGFLEDQSFGFAHDNDRKYYDMSQSAVDSSRSLMGIAIESWKPAPESERQKMLKLRQRLTKLANSEHSDFEGFGIAMELLIYRLTYDKTAIAFPWWLVVAATAVLPSWAAYKLYHHRARRREGRCLTCGYDLRATPGRCPECGAIPTSK